MSIKSDQKFIIVGKYVFSGKQFFCGEAINEDYAILSANIARNMLTNEADSEEWNGDTLEITSHSTGLNFLNIHILKIANLLDIEYAEIHRATLRNVRDHA